MSVWFQTIKNQLDWKNFQSLSQSFKWFQTKKETEHAKNEAIIIRCSCSILIFSFSSCCITLNSRSNCFTPSTANFISLEVFLLPRSVILSSCSVALCSSWIEGGRLYGRFFPADRLRILRATVWDCWFSSDLVIS